MYTINLHQTLLTEIGTIEEYEIEIKPSKQVDYSIPAGQTLDIQLTKIDVKGVSLYIPEQTINAIAMDAVTLEEFTFPIRTFPVERRFYTQIPEDEVEEMVEKINTNTFEVDIEPIINEVIFLNVPYAFHKDPKSTPQSFSTQNQQESSPFAKLKNKNT